jgi:predicted aspartyl protease
MQVEYSRVKFPPAPVLNIELSAPRDGARVGPFPALIDTGGDFILVPQSWLLDAGAPEMRWAYLRGLWSEQRPVTLYLVDLHLESGILPEVEVFGVEEEEADEDQEIVLGRNVLNQLILLLDGPRKQTEVLARRPLKL